jgi:AraC-like DNA-binding protein
MNGRLSQFAGAYREWAPAPELKDHVRCLWVNDLSDARNTLIQVVPDGCVDVIWTARGLQVAGPDTVPILDLLRPREVVVGARFHPGAAYRWLGIPLSEIVNQRVPLAEFWREDAEGLETGAQVAPDATAIALRIQETMLARLPYVGPADSLAAFLSTRLDAAPAAYRMPNRPARMAQFAARIGLSERTLRRRCNEMFGYGLKTLDRIIRFQRFFQLAARSAHPQSVDLALEAGYADQSHLAREVHRLAGDTVSRFLAQIHP